jgi:hypothetical protein
MKSPLQRYYSSDPYILAYTGVKLKFFSIRCCSDVVIRKTPDARRGSAVPSVAGIVLPGPIRHAGRGQMKGNKPVYGTGCLILYIEWLWTY